MPDSNYPNEGPRSKVNLQDFLMFFEAVYHIPDNQFERGCQHYQGVVDAVRRKMKMTPYTWKTREEIGYVPQRPSSPTGRVDS